MREERGEGEKICPESLKEHSPILQFAGSTWGSMDAGEGRGAPMSMMVGDTELF